jgi:signal transduction histidine kinase
VTTPGSHTTSPRSIGLPAGWHHGGTIRDVIAEPAPLPTEDRFEPERSLGSGSGTGESAQAGLDIAELVHELRTPLHTARLALDLLDAQDKTVATIRSSLTHIHDLLALTSGQADPLRSCSLRTVVTDAVLVADPAHRVVVNDLLALDPEILLQPAVARQLVVILLDNALKYSAADQPVGLTLEHTEGGVVLDVVDHGSGIAPTEAESVFVAGRRGSAAGGSQGNGLGLAIARRFARAAGGDVLLVNSSAGLTTFRLMLPVSPISDFVVQGVEIHKF